MIHAVASEHVAAPAERVVALYREPTNWPSLFPGTIRHARVVRRDGDAAVVEVKHVEGKVVNVLRDLSATRIELTEWKRRYRAVFLNDFRPEAGGTRYTLTARVELRWPYRLLAPFVKPLVLARMRRFVLAPLKVAAERGAAGDAADSRVLAHDERSAPRVKPAGASPVADVLVIGAGQAGLSMAWALRRAPLRLELVDRAARLGDSWRRRWDSLRLFTPRNASALPGLALPGDPEGYPTKDELADYLEAYGRWLGVSVRVRTGIRRLWIADALFNAETDRGDVLLARAVVLAPGAFQEPILPPGAHRLSSEVLQLTAATYRNPAQLPRGRILVVGDGATGRQIALELSRERETLLATGRLRVVTAQRILGRDQIWWSERLGLLRAPRESGVGRLLRRLEPFPGSHLTLRRLRGNGVTVAGRLRAVEGRSATFADGTATEVDAIVWAVGYRERSDWIDIPGAKDSHGRFLEWRGLSPVPRLYCIGRDWQWTRGSGLLQGVARDAAFVADQIVKDLCNVTSGVAAPGRALATRDSLPPNSMTADQVPRSS